MFKDPSGGERAVAVGETGRFAVRNESGDTAVGGLLGASIIPDAQLLA